MKITLKNGSEHVAGGLSHHLLARHLPDLLPAFHNLATHDPLARPTVQNFKNNKFLLNAQMELSCFSTQKILEILKNKANTHT